MYSRTNNELTKGKFKVKGSIIDIHLAHNDIIFRINFWGNEIEYIQSIEPKTGNIIETHESVRIFPANIFLSSQKKINNAINKIQDDLKKQVDYFEELNLVNESKRIKERTTFDIEMIKELGYCSGIENYSRYLDGRKEGDRPFCLLDYFPKDFLTVIDESHVTIPQIRAMYGGDRSRKTNLVEHGFRLPSALDNRPLKFEEFEKIINQTIYVSATPADYELIKSNGVIVEQIIRPTGVLDPKIEVRKSKHQIDDLLEEIRLRINKKERVLVVTLTKRMSEELSKYLTKFNIKSHYIHSDVDTMERVEILHSLKIGEIDVLIGVNLLREGLDLPQVSLVSIIDADKEGFLRSERALTQTAGRAARNINGKVIMYADKITKAMKQTIDETNRRRKKQIKFNLENGIKPKALNKNNNSKILDKLNPYKRKNTEENFISKNVSIKELDTMIKRTKNEMQKMAKELNFIGAAKMRDELYKLEEKRDKKKRA